MAGGRPAFVPTEDQRKNVEILIGLGIPREEIVAMVRDKNDKPISIPTWKSPSKRKSSRAQSN